LLLELADELVSIEQRLTGLPASLAVIIQKAWMKSTPRKIQEHWKNESADQDGPAGDSSGVKALKLTRLNIIY
jgi:hypothetical protein